jgi:DNA-directed RNA polymerase specialized sigma24 family protein
MASPTPPSNAPGVFEPTCWSMVIASRRDSPDGRAALERLCRTYWLPVYGYLRRRGQGPADAEDLTQGFFAYVLEGDFLQRPDPAKGRFRGYLIGALKHYLSRHFEKAGTAKRGGGVRPLEWEKLGAEREFAQLDQPQLDPASAYETGWALAIFAQALRRLGAGQAEAGRSAQFAELRPFLSITPTRGDYDAVAARLNTTRAHVAVLIFRLNRRYAELVRLEVAASVQDPAEIEAEMRHLLLALRR